MRSWILRRHFRIGQSNNLVHFKTDNTSCTLCVLLVLCFLYIMSTPKGKKRPGCSYSIQSFFLPSVSDNESENEHVSLPPPKVQKISDARASSDIVSDARLSPQTPSNKERSSGFNPAWKLEFPWVREVENGMCTFKIFLFYKLIFVRPCSETTVGIILYIICMNKTYKQITFFKMLINL